MKKIILIVLITSFLLGGCTRNTDSEVGYEKPELDFLISEAGTVVLPLTKYRTLNPLINENELYFYFSKLIFEGLFEFDNNLEPIPKLVENFRVDSGKNVILKLREDILWHDGQEFTSRDVKFTIDVLGSGTNTIYTGLSSSYIDLNRITSVNILDEYNIEIIFERESPNMLGLLTFPIIPEHKFTNVRMALQEDYIPIGTGPFKYESSNRFKNINLTANENYRFGKPRIENIVGRILDKDLFTTSYEAGQIDITIISQVDWNKYKQNSSIEVIEFISSNYEFLGFNFDKEIFSDYKGNAIRKAIYHGIDIKHIIDNIYLGHASHVNIPIHPDSSFLIDDSPYEYNPETSINYLKRVGFKDTDGNGILEDKDGNELSFRYLTNPSNVLRRRTAELIKNDLNNIGIEIIFDFETTSNEEDNSVNKELDWNIVKTKVDESDFDLVQLGLDTSILSDIGHLLHTNGNNNFINYSDEKMDSLISNYEHQNSNGKEKDNLYKYIVDETPYIGLLYRHKAMLINSKIIGELTPTYYNPYNGLENCFTTRRGD